MLIQWKNWSSPTVWKFYFQNISRIFPYTENISTLWKLDFPTFFHNIFTIFPSYGTGPIFPVLFWSDFITLIAGDEESFTQSRLYLSDAYVTAVLCPLNESARKEQVKLWGSSLVFSRSAVSGRVIFHPNQVRLILVQFPEFIYNAFITHSKRN